MADMEEPRPVLPYALPDVNRPRWSKLAITSLLIPILAVPATGAIAEELSGSVRFTWAWRLPGIGLGLAAVLGVATTALTMHRIRSSAGRLRGRMLALIGFALDVVLIFMVVMVLYAQRNG
jgi:hypothetical protein